MTVYKDPQDLVEATIGIIDAILAGEEPQTNTLYSNDVIDVPSVQCPGGTVTDRQYCRDFF